MNDERFESLERRMDIVERWQRDAVPNGDALGHRRYHELMIEGIEWRKRLVRAVLEKSIAGLAWSTMLFIGYAMWNYFITLVRRGS